MGLTGSSYAPALFPSVNIHSELTYVEVKFNSFDGMSSVLHFSHIDFRPCIRDMMSLAIFVTVCWYIA